jgi:peptidoglycan hydrolase-like protein with peptidoglycan-binding domain
MHMSLTKIAEIDKLWQDPAAEPIRRNEPDAEVVGVIQDLLIGHGYRLPGIIGLNRGVFGPQTQGAVAAFQGEDDQEPTGDVDHKTLHRMSEKLAVSPLAACGYLAFALDTEWSGFVRLVGLTAQFEAAGKFTATNLNSDNAGLSFGLIQWAQKPGRLNEILRAFERAQPDRFIAVFGSGVKATADGLLAHTAKPRGGVDPGGRTTDPKYDLVNGIWRARFVSAGQDRVWQKTQINEAVTAFRRACERLGSFAAVARSERAVAFVLDVANQFGECGLENICASCVQAGMDEAAMMQAVKAETVRRVRKQFGDGNEVKSTETRREQFLTTKLLSDSPFEEG